MATERRLIDANALKDYVATLEASGGHKYYRKGMDDTLHFHMPNIIDDTPTVDAVEVVRCKDCVHRVEGSKMCDHPKAIGWDAIEPEDDDFCSYGERRTDNGK